MASTTFPLQIISPATLMFDGQAELVEIPGAEGDFGVLPGHAPFLSMLRPGVVTVTKGGTKKRFFVSDGYADVSPEATVILSDSVQAFDTLTLADALAAVEQATDLSLNAESVRDRARAAKQREAAEALVQALKAA